MFSFLRIPIVLKSATWILILSLIITIDGCYYYKVVSPSEPPGLSINRLQDKGKFIILHIDDKVWKISDIVIDNEFLTGRLNNLVGHDSYKTTDSINSNRYKKSGYANGSDIMNEAHIYVNEFNEIENGRIFVPLSAILKIEIYDRDTGATLTSWILSGLGVAVGAGAILTIIVLLTKSSCPFVYAFNGTDFNFSGEIFSGATQPGLERDDYLSLPAITETEGKYQVRISNEVKEIQSVNLAGLIIADHPEKTSVLMDKYGIIHSICDPSSPVEAKNIGGTDVVSLVNKKDSLSWLCDDKGSGKRGVKEVVLTFIKPADSRSAKLVIRAKNSFWLDALFLKFHSLFGENYDEFAKKQEAVSGEKLREWSLNQNIPLSVYIEKNDKWKFVDYFNIAGPMALRDDILPVNLEGITGDSIKIKLVCGFQFWEIDYAGLDFSNDGLIKSEALPIVSAIDEKGKDVKQLLSEADYSYYIQEEVGNQVLLAFETPELKDFSRTVFLHTRGYYKILRDMDGKTDKKSLRSFRKLGRLAEYSRELYDLLPLK